MSETNPPPVAPDYGTVQATLCVNLMRRGVVDQIIPREELGEWAHVLSDLACKPLQEENERLRTALQNIQALAAKRQHEGGPDGNLKTIEEFAIYGLEGKNP